MILLPQKVLHLHKALEKKNSKIYGEYIITEKLDGNYVYCEYNALLNRWSQFFTSSCKPILALDWVSMRGQGIVPKESCRFIFEAYIPDGNVYDVNSRLKRKYEDAKDIKLYLHDIIYFPQETAITRYTEKVKKIEETSLIKQIPFIDIASYDSGKWEKHFNDVVTRGGEGIVVKKANGLYHPDKRNETLMKLKEEITLDLLCTGIYSTIGEKGETSLNATLMRGNGKEITVVIPKDEDQKRFLSDSTTIIGKICEIRAMKELPDGSLREPRFKFVREDKI